MMAGSPMAPDRTEATKRDGGAGLHRGNKAWLFSRLHPSTSSMIEESGDLRRKR